MTAVHNALLIARVRHLRRTPVRHALCYEVPYLCFPADRLHDLAGPLFSLNRFNLFSLYDCDDGVGTAHNEILQRYRIEAASIERIIMPRLLGFVFNPVSFRLCRDGAGHLRAVLAEVHNTFGERHLYICRRPDGGAIGPDDVVETEKVFHVSPFLPVRGRYRFRFNCDDTRIDIRIDYDDGDERVLTTSMIGTRRPLGTRSLLACAVRFPLMTFMTVARIYLHALRLKLKGLPYLRKPPQSGDRIT